MTAKTRMMVCRTTGEENCGKGVDGGGRGSETDVMCVCRRLGSFDLIVYVGLGLAGARTWRPTLKTRMMRRTLKYCRTLLFY